MLGAWRRSRIRRRAEPRVACASGRKVRIYDPVAGGAALVVIDVGSQVFALAAFKDR